jgi:hypothetical protein
MVLLHEGDFTLTCETSLPILAGSILVNPTESSQVSGVTSRIPTFEEREFEGYLGFLSFHAEYTFDP